MWNEDGVTKKKMKKSTVRFVWAAIYLVLATIMAVTMVFCYSGLPAFMIIVDILIIVMDLIYCGGYIFEGLILKKDEQWEEGRV